MVSPLSRAAEGSSYGRMQCAESVPSEQPAARDGRDIISYPNLRCVLAQHSRLNNSTLHVVILTGPQASGRLSTLSQCVLRAMICNLSG